MALFFLKKTTKEDKEPQLSIQPRRYERQLTLKTMESNVDKPPVHAKVESEKECVSRVSSIALYYYHHTLMDLYGWYSKILPKSIISHLTDDPTIVCQPSSILEHIPLRRIKFFAVERQS